MAEEPPEVGEESGETVGTGLRARAWRGGGTRLGAPGRFGGAAGRADPVLGELPEAWRVGFSERVVPEPARIAARGLVPAAKAQEQRRPGQARGEVWQEARGAVARWDAERSRRGVEGRSVAGSRGSPRRGATGVSGLPGLRGPSSGGVALRAIAHEWAGRSAEGAAEHGSRVRLYAKGWPLDRPGYGGAPGTEIDRQHSGPASG